MAKEPKTRPTGASVEAFLAAAEPARRRRDGEAVCALMHAVSGAEAEMWGPSIVGFGRYASPSGDWPRIAFAPRRSSLVLYLGGAFEGREAVVARLGGVKTRGGCLYVADLAKVDASALEALCRGVWGSRETHC